MCYPVITKSDTNFHQLRISDALKMLEFQTFSLRHYFAFLYLDSSRSNKCSNYTVGHKKRATLFGIITPMFRGGLFHFLHQWKQEKILYRGITKFATLPQLSLHYLRKFKNTQNSTF